MPLKPTPQQRLFTHAARSFYVGLAIYVVGFFLLRTMLSSTIGVDDVEQMIYAQDWRWGYNPSQPPFYTWLVLVATRIMGGSALAPQLVRYGILFLTFVFMYACARRIIRDPDLQVLAAFAPVLIYFVGWGAHQGFTHSALVGATTTATLWAMFRVVERGTWGEYLVLGIAFGLGLQSKYNFGMLMAALLLAAGMDRAARSRVLAPRMLLPVTIGIAMLAPSIIWLLQGHDLRDVLGSYVTYKAGDVDGGGSSRLPALWSILRSSVSFIASFLVAAVVLFPQALRRLPGGGDAREPDCGRLLGRFLILIYGVFAIGALAGLLEHVKIRWMYPVLILFPLYYLYRAERVGVTIRQMARLRAVLLGFVGLTVVLWMLQPAFNGLLCGRCRLLEPYPALAEAIAADSGFVQGTIIAADEHIAGNFRARFPAARVVALPYPFYVPSASRSGGCLVVWNARNGETIPARLAKFLKSVAGVSVTGGDVVHFAEGVNRANHRALRLAYTSPVSCER
ncbi:MAG: Lipopolysaccharide core galacturonosyltransferase RgtA [Gammaproteobacteria bacterium]|nr:Lipopolysaccharide core galacturonosyltransferase RgtA [Gammaproteobacteria bacterium]